MSQSSPSRWQKLSEKLLTSARIFDLKSATFRHPLREIEKEFAVLRAPEWVNVVVLTPDFQLVLVNQFRFGSDGFSLEIPGGIADHSEDPTTTAVRELREETGYVGKNPRVIGRVRPNPAFQNNWCSIVLLESAVRAAEMSWDADEEIEVSTRPVDEVFELARSGAIDHSLVVAALFFFAPIWAKLKSAQSRAGV
jgi:ADP-ribose diphosphatase